MATNINNDGLNFEEKYRHGIDSSTIDDFLGDCVNYKRFNWNDFNFKGHIIIKDKIFEGKVFAKGLELNSLEIQNVKFNGGADLSGSRIQKLALP